MDWLRRIRNQYCQGLSCWTMLIGFIVAMLSFLVVVNIYFLFDRYSQLWQKTIYRLTLYAVENLFFIWRVFQIQKVEDSLYKSFVWMLITFLPIVLADSLLEVVLYFTIGKDASYKSKVQNHNFPGSQESMIGMYFQFYLYSFFFALFAQVGFIIFRIFFFRHGRQEILNIQELQSQIEAKLTRNNQSFQPDELRQVECSICQAELFQNQNIVKLRCKHFFHKQCISQWLVRIHQNYGILNCPNCRTQLTF